MKDITDKVVYQIYPKSFKDTNNDGLGDIKGITEKLDYLAYLGVDYLWLNPFFVSPQNDNGYDVEDYCGIDELFGTMEDLEELILEAQKRNIYLMFDMVFNHTSTKHIWFQKALSGQQKYKDYYIFKKPVNGQMPTNWESKFGGPVWEYVEEFDEYYLHLFDKTQADLNWHNPEVQKEMISIINFWLEKGIKGFRFDVINLIDKMEYENDYEGVGKKYYTDGPKVHDYLNLMNINSYGLYEGIMTVGEMSATSVENCINYSNPKNNELDMAFNFHHLKVDYQDGEKWSKADFDFLELKKLFNTWQVKMQEGHGWNALFWNCHDQPRSISRFGNDKKYHKQSAKMLATVIHLQRGTPYIYQGEEIGMTNNYFTHIDQYCDVESKNYYDILLNKGLEVSKVHEILQSKSRDNSRSPMQWNKDGGFSSTNSWMQQNPNTKYINVEDSLNDQDSILEYYRKLIQLRKTNKTISKGVYQAYQEEHEHVYGYKRVSEYEEILVLNNFYETVTSIDIDDVTGYEVLLSNYSDCRINRKMLLRPYETLVLKRRIN